MGPLRDLELQAQPRRLRFACPNTVSSRLSWPCPSFFLLGFLRLLSWWHCVEAKPEQLSAGI
jgi:hypothetical protein